jgi:DNA-binding GntR family transcriptional regulator
MIRPDELEDRMQRGALVRGGLMSRPAERPLTPRQSAVLDLIRRDAAQLGEPVPAALLARQLGVSHERVRVLLSTLHGKGYLARESSPADPL